MTALVVLAILILTSVSITAMLAVGFRFPVEMSSFRCKIRAADGDGAVLQPWPWRRYRAAWVHDVLLVRRGLLLVDLTALAVRAPQEPLRDTRPGEVHRLGSPVLALVVRLDDGTFVEVAAAAPDRIKLVGPFLAAAIPGLPQGPRERRNLGR
jgi:hypothetical protein